MIELLSPVGDFECLKAAVQNGADAVYFGASSFSARAFASNFDDEILEKAITYGSISAINSLGLIFLEGKIENIKSNNVKFYYPFETGRYSTLFG